MEQASLEALLPYGGGLLALFVLLWVVDKFTGGIVEELGKQLLGRFQSNRQQDVLKPKALRAYTAAVHKNHSSHTLGFRRDDAPIMVEKVYVPARYEADGVTANGSSPRDNSRALWPTGGCVSISTASTKSCRPTTTRRSRISRTWPGSITTARSSSPAETRCTTASWRPSSGPP